VRGLVNVPGYKAVIQSVDESVRAWIPDPDVDWEPLEVLLSRIGGGCKAEEAVGMLVDGINIALSSLEGL